jgi:putative transposase
MPYTSNKYMPRIRRDATRLFRSGWSARKVGRHLGFHHTAILKWVKKAERLGDYPIPTQSSEPHRKWKKISEELERRIVGMRRMHGRCTEAIYLMLKRTGIVVPKSTIHRVLDRNKCLKKKSPWKRYHPHQERPKALKSGDLVQMDTIHLMTGEKTRIYVFTLIDVYSRCTYAKAFERMSGKISLGFVREAEESMFRFKMLQSDHGPEFGSWFVTQAMKNHRYTRIGKPNDNAHIERFNRTLQEECLDKIPRNVQTINFHLEKYLSYYNNQRIHLGISAYPKELVVPRL